MPIDFTEFDKQEEKLGIAPTETHYEQPHGATSQNIETVESFNQDPLINLITMDDIVNHVNDPTLQLVGDGHIIKGKDRVHVIAGYAGVGKSRGVNYLAYCGATE